MVNDEPEVWAGIRHSSYRLDEASCSGSKLRGLGQLRSNLFYVACSAPTS